MNTERTVIIRLKRGSGRALTCYGQRHRRPLGRIPVDSPPADNFPTEPRGIRIRVTSGDEYGDNIIHRIRLKLKSPAGETAPPGGDSPAIFHRPAAAGFNRHLDP